MVKGSDGCERASWHEVILTADISGRQHRFLVSAQYEAQVCYLVVVGGQYGGQVCFLVVPNGQYLAQVLSGCLSRVVNINMKHKCAPTCQLALGNDIVYIICTDVAVGLADAIGF